jgi:hypothetical protein
MDSSRIWWDVGLTPPQGVSSFTIRPSARDLWVDVQGSNARQNYSDAATLYTVTVTGSGSATGTITVNLPGL